MALYPGKLAYAGIALQPQTATPVTPKKYIPVKDINFDTQPKHTYITEYRNKMESSRAPIRTGVDTTGTMTLYAYPEPFLYTLWGACGAATTTSPAAGVYIHTITPAPADVPAWTMTQGLKDLPLYMYPNAKTKSWKFSIKGGEPASIDVEYIANAVVRTNNVTPVYQTVTPPPAYTFANAAAYIEGSVSTLVQELALTIERNTAEVNTMAGSLDATYIYPQDFKASGNVKLFFDSETEYSRFMGLPASTTPSMQTTATPLALKFTMISVPVSATYNHAVTIEMPECYYDKIDFKRATDGYVGVAFDFTAAYNETAACSFKATMQNGVSLVTPS